MLQEQLIVARWAMYLDFGLLFGLPLFALYSRQGRAAAVRSPRLLLVALAIGGALLSAWSFLVMTSSMMGAARLSLDREALGMVLTDTNVGWAFVARMIALPIVIAVAAVGKPRGRGAAAAASFFAGMALASLAWNGHGAADDGLLGYVHLAGDVVHLLAASAWIGALAAFLWATAASCRNTPGAIEAAQRALAGFATAGSVIVGLIVLTGLINSAILVGPDHLLSLGTTGYGRLLMAKLVLFAGMLVLAATNRFRLTPRLEAAIGGDDRDEAVAALRRSLWLEASAGTAILALVAWLGTLPPPASG